MLSIHYIFGHDKLLLRSNIIA